MQNDFLAFMPKTTHSPQVILLHEMIKMLICCFSSGVLFYFDCLRASYFTVRSIDTMITFLPIFIIFGYITSFTRNIIKTDWHASPFSKFRNREFAKSVLSRADKGWAVKRALRSSFNVWCEVKLARALFPRFRCAWRPAKFSFLQTGNPIFFL